MTIEFSLHTRQREMQAMIHGFAETIIRPEALKWDREHGVPNEFLSRIVMMAKSMGMYAEGPIENPKDLGPALKRAIAVVKKGEPALIDVVSQGR